MHTYNNISKIYFLKKDAFGEKYLYELDTSENKETFIDGKSSEIKILDSDKVREKCGRLYDILKKYDKNYVNNSILDGVEFTFVIEFDDESLDKIYFKNKFPEKFSDLISIIKEN